MSDRAIGPAGMPETRFHRPADHVITRLVERALASADADAAGPWELIETGSSSLVAITEHHAVRISRDVHAATHLERSQSLVDSLPALPFDVPRSLGGLVTADGLVAVATQRLMGKPHPYGSGDPQRLKALLDAIHAIDSKPFMHLLAPRRSYAGGDQWYEVMVQDVIPRLPVAIRDAARRAVDALAALPADQLVFSHGDLAGGNVLWNGHDVSGVLDWDLASLDDPAEDIASLAVWHGWDLVEALATPEEQVRADVIRRTFPLQVVASATIRGRPQEEIDRAITRAVTRFSGG